jgi:hypothetical protein
MTTPEKEALIDRFAAGAAAFDDVPAMEPALRIYRPFAEAWTIHEHVVHFAESEATAFHRYRKAVAEPGGPVVGYDEEKWTAALGYHETSFDDALTLIKVLRRMAAAHLRSIVTRDWTTLTYTHSSAGPVSLEAWIALYVDHVRFHRELIDRNRTLFQKR